MVSAVNADFTKQHGGGTTAPCATVQLELPLPVLCRLLREHNLKACEFRCLDQDSHRAGCWAVKASCTWG